MVKKLLLSHGRCTKYLSEACTALATATHNEIYAEKQKQSARTPSIRMQTKQNINMVLMMRGQAYILAITNHNVIERVYSSSESTGLGVPLGEFNWEDG